MIAMPRMRTSERRATTSSSAVVVPNLACAILASWRYRYGLVWGSGPQSTIVGHMSASVRPPRLQDKLCLVTGGSRGIGAAIARAFAAEGARVVIAARKPEELEATAAAINADHPGAAIARACHTGRPE